MKNIKILIIILSILIVGVIIAMIAISITNKEETKLNIVNVGEDTSTNISNNNNNISVADIEGIREEGLTVDATIVKDRNLFFSIEKMMKNYFLYLNAGNTNAVYSMLESNYRNLQGISTENVLQIARQNISYDGTFEAKEVYAAENTDKPIYYIFGTLEKNNSKQNVYYTMYRDILNSSFALKPITETEYKQYVSKASVEVGKNIEANNFNKVVSTIVSDEDMAEKYLNSYIYNALYSTQEAYNTLNEEYKNKKFGTMQNYITYLNERLDVLKALDRHSIRSFEEFASEEEYLEYINSLSTKYLKQYSFYTNNDKNYCLCVDSYDNYYIFEIVDVMNYKLILDTYTIDLPAFLEEYNDSTNEEKSRLNLAKIIEALNDKDYLYVYNKLDEQYRISNISDFEVFKSTLSQSLFNKNYVEVNETTELENGYKFSLTLTDKTGIQEGSVQMIITVELKEGTDFVIRFE